MCTRRLSNASTPANTPSLPTLCFNQAGAEQLSITDWMGAAQKSIQAQEKRKRLASSAPKMFVGKKPGLGQPAAQELAANPLSRGRNSPNGRRTN